MLLADEPTGELDSATAHEVFSALQTANTELGVTVLVVTHDPAVSSQVRRTIAIRDGRTSSETIRHAATDEHGQTALHAREYATLDRAGRIQLPREMTVSRAAAEVHRAAPLGRRRTSPGGAKSCWGRGKRFWSLVG